MDDARGWRDGRDSSKDIFSSENQGWSRIV
jgi:hypothetical protein